MSEDNVWWKGSLGEILNSQLCHHSWNTVSARSRHVAGVLRLACSGDVQGWARSDAWQRGRARERANNLSAPEPAIHVRGLTWHN